jgi:CRP-like cAMP-binding protein
MVTRNWQGEVPLEQFDSAHRHDVPLMLSKLPLFQELAVPQLRRLASGTHEKRIVKGEMLFKKGDEATGFYIVLYGQIKLAFPSVQGAEKVIEIIGPRQSFGEAVMFANRPFPVFAQALGDTLLLHLSKAIVFDMLRDDTTFARAMLAGMSMRLHSLVQDVESYSSRSGIQRVIGYILQHCPTPGADDEVTITLETSKVILASRLNLTPETLSRILAELSQSGLLTISGRNITIHQLQRLRAFDL